MLLALLNINEIHLDVEQEEFLEIANAFIKKNKRKYNAFVKKRKGMVS